MTFFLIEGDPLTDEGLEYLFGLLLKKRIILISKIYGHMIQNKKMLLLKLLKCFINIVSNILKRISITITL